MAKVLIPVISGVAALGIVGTLGTVQVLGTHDVELTVDGTSRTLEVRDRTVGDLLEDQGITLGEYDVVLPGIDTKIIDGLEVDVAYARPLELTVGDESRTIWTTARTVGDALREVDLDAEDPAFSASRSAEIGREGLDLEVKETTKQTGIPFEKTETTSDEKAKGTSDVTTQGVDGVMTEVYTETYRDGQLTSTKLKSAVVTREPVAEVTTVGTRPASSSRSSSAGGSSCEASYYWQGQQTANGEQFDPGALSAAHKEFAFGTKVKVTNPNNDKSVVVRINDRGPFVSGRCLDLSQAAMETIGGTAAGVITVTYEVVS